MAFLDEISDPDRIERQLDRLAARARGRRAEALVQDGVPFRHILDDRDRVVSLLARALGDGSYRPGIATMARAHLAGKPRDLARVGALDLVVHAVVGDVLRERLEPTLSDRLYSYRRGRSAWQALRAVARAAIAHRRAVADPRARGLYVLRSDVRSYTDSIPLEGQVVLWRELAEVIGGALESGEVALVRALVQPEVASNDGTARRTRGLLFGVATTAPIANMYLRPLDAALETLGTYARFGDDVLLASAEPDVVRDAKQTLERVLEGRGLAANPRKLRVLYWNGAARPSEAWPDAVPTDALPFLGAEVRFDGTIALPPAKWRAMLHDLRGRIRRTGRLLEGESLSARAGVLADVVEQAFDVRSPLALAYAPVVSDLVSDRAQLRQLDHVLALWIAETATGVRGPRAFRDLPPRAMRRAGLGSRLLGRNRGRHGGRRDAGGGGGT
jgi:hypothetical protein